MLRSARPSPERHRRCPTWTPTFFISATNTLDLSGYAVNQVSPGFFGPYSDVEVGARILSLADALRAARLHPFSKGVYRRHRLRVFPGASGSPLLHGSACTRSRTGRKTPSVASMWRPTPCCRRSTRWRRSATNRRPEFEPRHKVPRGMPLEPRLLRRQAATS